MLILMVTVILCHNLNHYTQFLVVRIQGLECQMLADSDDKEFRIVRCPLNHQYFRSIRENLVFCLGPDCLTPIMIMMSYKHGTIRSHSHGLK